MSMLPPEEGIPHHLENGSGHPGGTHVSDRLLEVRRLEAVQRKPPTGDGESVDGDTTQLSH